MYMTHIGGLPLDIRTAYITECFEPLALYVSTQRNEDIPREHPNSRQPSLFDCLNYIISLYGQTLFANEVISDILSCRTRQIVNNRVQLMHLKNDMGNKQLLDDKERVTYSRKLHILYRLIILQLVGLNTSSFSDRLTKMAGYWERYLCEQEDTHNG